MAPKIEAPTRERHEKSDDVRCRVVTVNPETGKPNNRKVLFEGLEADAETFVANNYPRPHIEPGGGDPVPDVVVQTVSNGKVTATRQFHTDSGFADYNEPEHEGEGDN